MLWHQTITFEFYWLKTIKGNITKLQLYPKLTLQYFLIIFFIVDPASGRKILNNECIIKNCCLIKFFHNLLFYAVTSGCCLCNTLQTIV